jgi:hypothetical protein
MRLHSQNCIMVQPDMNKPSVSSPSGEPSKTRPVWYASGEAGYQQAIREGHVAVEYSVVAVACSVVLLLTGWGALHYQCVILEYMGVLWMPLVACVLKSVTYGIKSLKGHRSQSSGTVAILLAIVSLVMFGLWLILYGKEGK